MRARVMTGVLLAALCASGCKHRIQIQSDTSWEGLITDGDIHMHGTGDRTIEVSGGFKCASAHKTTSAGYLRMRIERSGSVFVETTAPFGSVEVCN